MIMSISDILDSGTQCRLIEMLRKDNGNEQKVGAFFGKNGRPRGDLAFLIQSLLLRVYSRHSSGTHSTRLKG